MKDSQKLATFKCDRQTWDAFLARAAERGTSGAALLKGFVEAYLAGRIDPKEYQEIDKLDKLLEARLAPIIGHLGELDERLGKLNT